MKTKIKNKGGGLFVLHEKYTGFRQPTLKPLQMLHCNRRLSMIYCSYPIIVSNTENDNQPFKARPSNEHLTL